MAGVRGRRFNARVPAVRRSPLRPQRAPVRGRMLPFSLGSALRPAEPCRYTGRRALRRRAIGWRGVACSGARGERGLLLAGRPEGTKSLPCLPPTSAHMRRTRSKPSRTRLIGRGLGSAAMRRKPLTNRRVSPLWHACPPQMALPRRRGFRPLLSGRWRREMNSGTRPTCCATSSGTLSAPRLPCLAPSSPGTTARFPAWPQACTRSGGCRKGRLTPPASPSWLTLCSTVAAKTMT